MRRGVLLGGRRRRMVFTRRDRYLQWTSPALEFHDGGFVVLRAKEWAERNGLRTAGFPNAAQAVGLR